MNQVQYNTRNAKRMNENIKLSVGKALKVASQDLIQRVGQARENISAYGLLWEEDSRKFNEALAKAWAEDHGHLIQGE